MEAPEGVKGRKPAKKAGERSGPDPEGRTARREGMQKLDQKGYTTSLIVGVGVAICVLVLVSWMVSTFIDLAPENDNLGIMGTLTEYAPTLFRVLIVGFIFVALIGLIRMLVGGKR